MKETQIMITDERLTAFINSLDTGNPAYLNELEKEARKNQCADYPHRNPKPVKDADSG